MSASAPKKRKKKSDLGKPSNSFANLVASTANKQLADHVEQRMGQYAQAIMQNLSKLVLDHIANIQTRHLALEELLIKSGGLTRDTINEEITNQEDQALGYETAEEAVLGDLVRIEAESKAEDETEYSEKEKLRINSLLREVEGTVQTLKELEEALVGMKAGEAKEITVKGENGEKNSNIKLTVKKVSRKKSKGENNGTQS